MSCLTSGCNFSSNQSRKGSLWIFGRLYDFPWEFDFLFHDVPADLEFEQFTTVQLGFPEDV